MFYLFLLFSTVSAVNVLVWNPLIGQSHVNFLSNIADVLHRNGHNVTVVSSFFDLSIKPFATKENVTKILFNSKYIKSYDWQSVSAANGDIWETELPLGSTMSWEEYDMFAKKHAENCRGFLENTKLVRALTDSKFEIGIAETYEMSAVGIFELLGVKKIMVVSALGEVEYHNTVTGIPQFPSFTPSWLTAFTDKMTFFERCISLKLMFETMRYQQKTENRIQAIFEEYHPGFPNIQTVFLKKTGVIMNNVNEFTETPRLRSNMIQYIGGSHIYVKQLSKEAKDLLSKRKQSVLFSLGSWIKSCDMPLRIKKAFADSFAVFPEVTFIWKYEDCPNEELVKEQYKNIEFSTWVPQNEILNDDRLALFITHGGMNSVLEASHTGVPMLVIPIYGDQNMNAANAASAVNVLVWNPVMGQSHVNFLCNIADVLHRYGHDVTIISSIHDTSLKPFTTKENVKKILFTSKYIKSFGWDAISAASGAIWDTELPVGSTMTFEESEVFAKKHADNLRGFLEDTELVRSLKLSNFRIGIAETFEMSAIGIFELLGIEKIIVIGTLGQLEYHNYATGIPQFPSFTPSWLTSFSDKMAFYERFISFKLMLEMNSYLDMTDKRVQDIFEEYHPGFPDIQKLFLEKTGVILINVNEFTETPRLKTNMIQYIGGSHIYTKPLSKEANDLLSKRYKTVLFSLGSWVKSCNMPLRIKKAFADAFSVFRGVTFIWKYEDCPNDNFVKKEYENIEFSSWIPQNELLIAHGIALKLERTNISKQSLVNLISKLIQNDSVYHKRSANMKHILKDRPEQYRALINHWIERLAMEDGPIENLALATREMSYFTIFSLDIITILLIVIIIIITIIYFVVKSFFYVIRYVPKSKGE